MGLSACGGTWRGTLGLMAAEQCQEPAVAEGEEAELCSQFWTGRGAAWWLNDARALPALLLLVTNHICISSQHSSCAVGWKHPIMKVFA